MILVSAGLGSHWPAKDLFSLLVLRIKAHPNATSYIVFWQEKRLMLADVCTARSCAHSRRTDGRQRASPLREAASTWDKSPFQPLYTATQSQGEATLGKKHLEITGIYYKREDLSNCPQRGKFLRDSCSLDVLLSWGKRVLNYPRSGLSTQCWM